MDLGLQLSSIGLLDEDNARVCGVAVKTIRRWRRLYERRGVQRGVHGGAPAPDCPRCDGRELDEASYSALLGFYLGDGNICRVSSRRPASSLRLSVVQDARYPASIDEIAQLIASVKTAPGWRRNVPGAVTLESVWKHWPCLFPQHGPGRKHERLIELAPWQREIVERHPREFPRGLFHSDGCRITNWTEKTVAGKRKRYEYGRYFFSNVSADIRGICVWALGLVQVPARDDGRKTVSVARREAVAVLDTFIGPKT